MPEVLLVQGTALHLPLRDASVHCCVTSPPYWNLRDYGTGTWQGGDAACDHTRQSPQSRLTSTLGGATTTQGGAYAWQNLCGRCGATRVDAQLGLEASPDEYVAAMVQVFREVKRVLRDDGTLWCNLGDSYTAHPNQRSSTDKAGPKQQTNNGSVMIGSRHAEALSAKNLLGMPWRVALALQADGWILRSDVIWDKPSCMPESVQDRPTRSHEYVFLFSKQAHYHYDAHAIREPWADDRLGASGATAPVVQAYATGSGRNGDHGLGAAPPYAGRNCRTVWRIASEPTGFQHYAAFPQALVRRCLLAGAPTQVCSQCGAPWRRTVERTGEWRAQHDRTGKHDGTYYRRNPGGGIAGSSTTRLTVVHGFAPTCACAAASVPATVLDPFCGSGTTLLVARDLGHHAIGLDLSYPYLHTIARERLRLTALAAWQGTASPTAPAIDYGSLPLFAQGAAP